MNTQFLKRPEGAIAYDDTGNGPLVVCAPSLGDVRGEYRLLAPQLVDAGYRVVTMDLRGLGESSTGWACWRWVRPGIATPRWRSACATRASTTSSTRAEIVRASSRRYIRKLSLIHISSPRD